MATETVLNLIRAEWYEVPKYWPEIEEWVAQALEGGSSIVFVPEEIRLGLLQRVMQLWLAIEDVVQACTVTRLDSYPRVKICTAIIIGGRGIDNWIHFEGPVAAWARQQGCDAIEGFGRKGWSRLMKAKGYDVAYTAYRKML